ncbi:MAG: hypothetical protein D6736_15100 [Nitrospinota bacterium]|nr:MAG: hypothetical protein D6736_15100 [Nitrospinota bacterium]
MSRSAFPWASFEKSSHWRNLASHLLCTLLFSLGIEKFSVHEDRTTLAALLATGQFTHDFPITVERLRALGLPVSTDMPEAIYRLMELYPQPGIRRPSVIYVPLPSFPDPLGVDNRIGGS